MIDDVVLKPVEGEFDLAAIHAHLDALPTAARDPQSPDRYLLSSHPDSLARALQARRSSQRVPYSVAVLDPGPTIILLSTTGSDTQPSRDFVEWLRKRQAIQILDEAFNDFTHECKDNLDFVFEPPEPRQVRRNMSSAWFEVWADDGLSPPYVLVVRDAGNGRVEILDPKEAYRVIHTSESYQDACDWLWEDEYQLITGRTTDGDAGSSAS